MALLFRKSPVSGQGNRGCHSITFIYLMKSVNPDDFVPLLPRILDGDKAAEEQFFKLSWGLLHAWAATSFSIPLKEREDFAIEVIERTLSKLQKFSASKGRFTTWLFAIARNYAADRGRKVQKGQDVLYGAMNEETLEWAPLDQGHCNDRLYTEEPPSSASPLSQALAEEMRNLAEKDRVLLQMVYSGLSSSEIADLQDMTAANVRQRHRRLLKMLKDNINNKITV